MTSDPYPVPDDRLDLQLARDGFVALVAGREAIDGARRWLLDAGYRVVTLPTDGWGRDPAAMHDALARSLDLPAYYGRNLDALNDCLSDVAAGEYGLRASDTGLVVVLLDVDRLLVAEPALAAHLAATFADAGRLAAVHGNRLYALLHSSDPTIELPPLTTSVGWNGGRWWEAPVPSGRASPLPPEE